MTNEIMCDLAVIGAGPAGTAAASHASAGGLSTVLIDRAEIGGTCLNRGCVPTKVWAAAAHLAHAAEWGKKIGITSPPPDFALVRAHQNEVVTIVRKGLAGALKKRGVAFMEGEARFVSPRELEAGGNRIRFKHALIACGTKPAQIFPVVPGFYTSDTLFSLEKLPASSAIVGAGAIGVEMAFFLAGLGTRVTLLEALDDILPQADADVRQTLKRELKKAGVEVMTSARIEEARGGENGCELLLEGGKTVAAEMALAAAGRRPDTEGLALDKAGVRINMRGFVETDDTMSTSSEGIYAAGDVAGKSLLAYTAHHEGITAAKNMLGHPEHMDYRFIPYIVFSGPEAAWVGRTEEQLKQTGVKYRAGKYFVRALARAQAGGEIAGVVKVLVGADNSLLGVHMVSPLATELIHAAAVAMAGGVKADRLAAFPFGHPTFSEALSLACADALGEPPF